MANDTRAADDAQTASPKSITVVKYREDDLISIILTWLLQVIALAAAITFGIFAVLSWNEAQHAKAQATTANLLALAALCANIGSDAGIYNGEVNAFCNQLFPNAWPALAGAAAKLVPDASYVSVPSASSSASSTISSYRTSSSSSTSPSGFANPSGIPPSSSSVQPSGEPSSTTATPSFSSTNSITATASSAPPPVTGGSSNDAAPGSSIHLTSGGKIGLAVGFAVGVPLVLVTVLTFLRYRRLRREKVI